jgi:hypothetical protein
VLTALLLAGTIPGIRAATSGTMEWIGLAKDGRGFEMVASGRPYVPWGFNYDRDYRMRLIEEFWADEWETVEQDFAEMKNLGANVVRVHLQLSAFMDSPTTANAANLDRLGRLLALAERTGLYLDLTGLACYRREKVPPWYDPLPEPARWAVQARFWEAVAGRCAASPAVFFYDLMNEPISPGPDCVAGDWLVGNLAGFWYCQRITTTPGERSQDEVARQWMSTLVAAIRRHDTRHLVSVGLLPAGGGFDPAVVAREVDFLCVHVYPKGPEMKQELEALRRFRVGKPVIIEEMYPIHCSARELRRFVEHSAECASGWISFYWGRTPGELAASGLIGDALQLEWLREFSKGLPAR